MTMDVHDNQCRSSRLIARGQYAEIRSDSVASSNNNYGKKNSCSFCQKTFRSNQRRKDHEASHTGITSFSCSFCARKFSTRRSVQFHERFHFGRVAFVCNGCGNRFSKQRALQRHQRSHVCLACNRQFTTKRSLLNDYLANNPRACLQCGTRFGKISRLLQHMQITHSESARFYVCWECFREFATRDGFLNHWKNRAVDGSSLHRSSVNTCRRNANYTCLVSCERLMHKCNLFDQQPVMTPKQIRCCGGAGFHLDKHDNVQAPGDCSLQRTDNLQREQYSAQQYDNNYSCSRCELSFISPYSLRRHNTWRHKKPPSTSMKRRFWCKTCNKKYMTNGELEEHRRHCDTQFPTEHKLQVYEHGKIRLGQHPCASCGKLFMKMSSLNVHRHLHCVPDYTFGCCQCGQRFPLQSSLWEHQLTHENPPPPENVQLDLNRSRNNWFSFSLQSSQSESWQVHEMQSQEDVQLNLATASNYTCTDCRAAFCDAASLRIHQLSMRSSEFYCGVCAESFDTSDASKMCFFAHYQNDLKNVESVMMPKLEPNLND